MSEKRIAELEEMLRTVLALSPRCFTRDCGKAAVYRMPTAVTGDAIWVCEEHCTCEENEFEEQTTELPWAALHRAIRLVLAK